MARTLAMAIVAFVVSFMLSGLWHGWIMADMFESLSGAEENMPLVALGYVVLAALMAIMYPIGAKGGSPVAEGFRFGALIGVLWIAPLSLILAGLDVIPTNVAIIDTLWHVAEQGVAGVAIAMVHARMGGAAA